MEKDLVEYITKSLVDDPDALTINEKYENGNVILELRVAPDDIGKVIGKYGRIAKAIRVLLSASAGRSDERYSLEILD